MSLKNDNKVLTRMVEQYKADHRGNSPKKIVITRVALIALGVKESVSPRWNGINVECRTFSDTEVLHPSSKHLATKLGVFVKKVDDKMSLVSCDLI